MADLIDRTSVLKRISKLKQHWTSHGFTEPISVNEIIRIINTEPSVNETNVNNTHETDSSDILRGEFHPEDWGWG